MESINERIALLIQHLGINIFNFSKRVGMNHTAIAKIVSGVTKPGYNTLEVIIKEFGVNPSWLMEGEGLMFKSETDKLIEQGKLTPLSNMEHIAIPLLDARAIASFQGNIYGSMTKLTTGNYFLATKIPGVDYEDAYALRIEGNSMAPRYTDGTIVLVRPVKEGRWQHSTGVHAVSLRDGMFTVKEIIDNKNNALILKASNPLYPAELQVQIADILCMFKVGRILDSPEE